MSATIKSFNSTLKKCYSLKSKVAGHRPGYLQNFRKIDDLLYQLEGGTLNQLSLRHEDLRTMLSEMIESMAQLSVES